MNNFLDNIEPTWKLALGDEFEKGYFKSLVEFVKGEYVGLKEKEKSQSGMSDIRGGCKVLNEGEHPLKAVYPPRANIFKAFDICPIYKVKVVILGQDPYHGEGQANGLCFAVNEGVKLPPSLKNIFKEIEADLGIKPDLNGDLSRWGSQGVLLLNSTLTVAKDSPGSHQGKGWEEFTDAVIKKLSNERENLVFILWGNYAKNKGKIIDSSKHLVLESAHPSPFSAYSGFFGSKPFSKANEYLKRHGLGEIDFR